jgi:Tol biopolymer transport system component
MMAKINRLGPLAAVVGLLAAVGLLVLMVVEAQPAEAIFPGKNGKIAYVTLTAPRGEEIYTINPDGSGKFRVTNTKNTDEERPGYSPDGKKIAYVRGGNQKTDSEIYTNNAGGGGRVQVTHNGTDNFWPSWGNRP